MNGYTAQYKDLVTKITHSVLVIAPTKDQARLIAHAQFPLTYLQAWEVIETSKAKSAIPPMDELLKKRGFTSKDTDYDGYSKKAEPDDHDFSTPRK